MRRDLLALGADDLASISNRGNVNRATRELDEGKARGELTETEGTIEVTWSDGPTTTIPADSVVSDAICTCPATSVCRHIVRTVLAYQRWVDSSEETAAPPETPWDPGDISDEALEDSFRASTLSHWRKLYDEPPGLVVELVRSHKPTARFHRLGHTIRFLVPDDPRYTRCDCDETAPCRHVALAIWAFRALPGTDSSGVIETTGPEPPLDLARISPVVESLDKMAVTGLAETPAARVDRIRATERNLRENGILWPAEVLHDLLRQWEHYREHDARFSPSRLADLFGELIVRCDALVAPRLPVPRLFVRGEERNSKARLGQTKLVGLGTTAVARHGAVDLVSLLQDTKSGKVMSVVETFPDPPPGSPRHTPTLSELARRPVFDSRDFATLGRSQLVVKAVRLNPNHTLSIGRSPTSAYGQDFNWDELLAPLYCESVAELRARIQTQPPASLRPRRIGEDLVVLPVTGAFDARFDSRSQTLRAWVSDANDERVELVHPYSNRGRSGLERALQWLTGPAKLRFVAARGRLTARGLVLSPTSLVFEDGGRREMVQPWIDDMDDHLEHATVSVDSNEGSIDLLDSYRSDLAGTLGGALVTGLRQRDVSELQRLLGIAKSLGLTSHTPSLEALVERDDSAALFELLTASKLAQDLG